MARSTAFLAALLCMMLAGASIAQAAAPAFDAPPPGTNCNRSCWKGNNLFGLKNILFKACGSKVTIVETNETRRGSGRSGPPKFGICNTYIYYRFKDTKELTAFQLCQSKRLEYLNGVVRKNYKQILKSPPKYSRC